MNPISTDLLTQVIQALFPDAIDTQAITLAASRDTEGCLNPQAWSQVMSLFLWFGFDVAPLHLELIASALDENPEFQTSRLFVQPTPTAFSRMSRDIKAGLPISEATFAVASLRAAVETMAKVLQDSGEAFDSRALPQLREAIDSLDEQINKRIEGEKL